MNVLATFATRDIADSMKDRLAEQGFDRHNMTVMSNRISQEPPEDAVLEIGTDLEKGFSGLEEKIGKNGQRALRQEQPHGGYWQRRRPRTAVRSSW